MPDSVLHRLFRQRLVKVYTDQTYQSIAKTASVQPHTVLAVPSWVQQEARGPRARSNAHGGYHCNCCLHFCTALIRSCRVAGSTAAIAAQLRASILYEDADMLVFNKPPGLHVQGGQHQQPSLDAVLRDHFSHKGSMPRQAARGVPSSHSLSSMHELPLLEVAHEKL